MADAYQLSDLQERLQKEIMAVTQAINRPLSAEDLASLVRGVVNSFDSEVPVADLSFYSELEDLSRYIRDAKLSIASLHPSDITTNHIPRATDELDAVVGATEEATNKIMDVCDEMTALGASCSPDVNQKLVACTTKIFEACNFQDITGQRITKVVETLKYIDNKISSLIKVVGSAHNSADVADRADVTPPVNSEKSLLNGPSASP